MSIFYPILVSFWFNFGVENRTRILETSWKRLWRVLGRLRVVSVRFWACWSVLAVSGSLWVASWGVLGRYHRPWEGLRGLQNTSKKWGPSGVRRSLPEGGGYPIGPAPFWEVFGSMLASFWLHFCVPGCVRFWRALVPRFNTFL